MNEENKPYMLLTFNDGGIPMITFHDTIDECKSQLSYVQHWFIEEWDTHKRIAISDIPNEET
jgi:hypothetical protein